MTTSHLKTRVETAPETSWFSSIPQTILPSFKIMEYVQNWTWEWKSLPSFTGNYKRILSIILHYQQAHSAVTFHLFLLLLRRFCSTPNVLRQTPVFSLRLSRIKSTQIIFIPLPTLHHRLPNLSNLANLYLQANTALCLARAGAAVAQSV
jgi:hypothetical protein